MTLLLDYIPLRERVNMLKNRTWVQDLADGNLMQFDRECNILSFAERLVWSQDDLFSNNVFLSMQ